MRIDAVINSKEFMFIYIKKSLNISLTNIYYIYYMQKLIEIDFVKNIFSHLRFYAPFLIGTRSPENSHDWFIGNDKFSNAVSAEFPKGIDGSSSITYRTHQFPRAS